MRKTFLLADDDHDDLELFDEAMQEVAPDLTLIQTINGLQVLKYLGQSPARPDLIILDINMPECTGIECLRAIKASPATRDIPVVIYTTSSNKSEAGEALRLGAEGLIIKPARFEELKRIITLLVAGLDGDLRAAIRSAQRNSQ